jgi:hypothetical protein
MPQKSTILSLALLASLPWGLSSSRATAASPEAPAAAATAQPSPEEAAKRKAWNAEMSRRPVPKNGCFNATYPSTEWQEVQCGPPSPDFNQERKAAGPKEAGPNDAGGGADFVAFTSGVISSATGSFLTIPSVTGASGESGEAAGQGGLTYSTNNIFTLQINTQSPYNAPVDPATFNTPACSGGDPGCSGWQQFVFSQTQGPPPTGTEQSAAPSAPHKTTPALFVEYWLNNWGMSPCPPLPAWALGGQPPGTTWINLGGNCVFNGPVTYVPPLTVADLTGPPNGVVMTATAGASQDTVTLATKSGMYAYSEPSVLSLYQVWTEAEFNVFGDCCRVDATFTSPTVLAVQTSINDGTMNPPMCLANDGTTGETNNLSFVPNAMFCCPYGGATPSIEFMEAYDTGHTHNAWCAATQIEGDPHITTADGKHYDFQAAGEFVSLRDPDGMEIQTRQTPIATTFFPGPDEHDGLATCVSINTAVAARVGKHRVTWEPNLTGVPDPSGLQLRIDGAPTALGANGVALGAGGRVAPSAGGGLEVDFPDGKTLLATPEWWASQGKWYLNVDVSHLGLVSDEDRAFGRGIAGAIANGSWLPALPNGASVGPMPAPLADRYDVLYKRFADAWRVSDRDSLFDYARGTSTETFTMRDWPKQNPPCVVPNEKPVEPASEAVAEAACRRVKDENRRVDCVFDVRVTGNVGFAKTYLDTQRNLAFSTTTSVTDDADPSQVGEWVTFTAFVAPYSSAATGVPSGTVQFAVDGSNAGEPVTVDAKGRARLETSRLKVGTHRVGASYVPGLDSAFLPSTSVEKIHEVRRCPCEGPHEQN